MVAHSVGPPLASKAVPWLQLARLTSGVWALMAIRVGAIPAGVVTGWRPHAMLDQRQIYRISYGWLIVAALKLLWDGMGVISVEYAQPMDAGNLRIVEHRCGSGVDSKTTPLRNSAAYQNAQCAATLPASSGICPGVPYESYRFARSASWLRGAVIGRVCRIVDKGARAALFLSALVALRDPIPRAYYARKLQQTQHSSRSRRRGEVLLAMLCDGTISQPEPVATLDATYSAPSHRGLV